MQLTGDLFETPEYLRPPIARRKDPETSKRAALIYDKNGREKDWHLLLRVVKKHPGHTSSEYGELLLAEGIERQRAIRMPTKRMSDLNKRGLVIVGEKRLCTVSKYMAQTYTAAAEK